MQFSYYKDEARVETVNKKLPKFVYYNNLRRSRLTNLTETNKYLIYDNDLVIIFHLPD